MDRILHVYGQHAWHDQVQIVGTADALRSLRTAIDAALSAGKAATSVLFVNDGEGFEVLVQRVDPTAVDQLLVPYTAEYAEATKDVVADDRPPSQIFNLEQVIRDAEG